VIAYAYSCNRRIKNNNISPLISCDAIPGKATGVHTMANVCMPVFDPSPFSGASAHLVVGEIPLLKFRLSYFELSFEVFG
jgi:hypothetical protein